MIFTRQNNQNVGVFKFQQGNKTSNLQPQTSLHFMAESRDIFSCLLPTETTCTSSIFNHNSNKVREVKKKKIEDSNSRVKAESSELFNTLSLFTVDTNMLPNICRH